MFTRSVDALHRVEAAGISVAKIQGVQISTAVATFFAGLGDLLDLFEFGVAIIIPALVGISMYRLNNANRKKAESARKRNESESKLRIELLEEDLRAAKAKAGEDTC